MGGDERLGVTSRIRPAAGRKRIWQIDDKVSFSLPVVVDHMYVDPATHQLGYHIQATIDLVEGEPALTRIDVRAPQGIDVVRMQREFRWASPLEIVRRTIPILLGRGIDPFAFDLPLTGYPAAAELGSPSNDGCLPGNHRPAVPDHRARLREGDREGAAGVAAHSGELGGEGSTAGDPHARSRRGLRRADRAQGQASALLISAAQHRGRRRNLST
jgi:hypothetical protein